MNTPLASPVPPDLRAVQDALRQEIFFALNCHQVGVIEEYDPAKQMASVRIAVLRITPAGEVPYPLLTHCPVYFPSGGDAYMTFPVRKGDTCLVLFNDRDLDNWFTTGNVVTPNSSRAHSLSDGMVLVGLRHLGNQPADVDPDAVSIWNAGTQISIRNDGTVKIALDGAAKVQIENGTVSLKDAFDALFATLTAWVNTGGSTPNTTTLTAIAAVKTQVDDLLQ